MKIVIDTNILVGACMGSRGSNRLIAALGDIPTALALLDIVLLDHIIVTAAATVSFTEQGWLQPFQAA